MAMTATAVHYVSMRFLRPFRAYRAGQVYEIAPGVARSLELDKIAVRHEPSPQLSFAEAPMPQSLERAEAPPARQRRRRSNG